jgi:hypothetical protein
VIDYSKKSFEDGTHAMQQLVGARSFEQAWEIQSQYAKKAFDAYVAQASKIGEMYVDLARSAYQPVEQATVRTRKEGVAFRARDPRNSSGLQPFRYMECWSSHAINPHIGTVVHKT